ADRFVELELAFFGQADEGGGSKHFGCRAEAEEHLGRGRLASFDICDAKTFAPEKFSFANDGDRCARRVGFLKLSFGDLLKACGVELGGESRMKYRDISDEQGDNKVGSMQFHIQMDFHLVSPSPDSLR